MAISRLINPLERNGKPKTHRSVELVSAIPETLSAESKENNQQPTLPGADDPPTTEADESLDEEEDLLSISGTVFDEKGQVIAGMEISASVRTLFLPQDEGFGAPASRHNNQAVTDIRGSYQFQSLDDGEYLIRTQANDLYEAAQTVVRAGTESANLVVRLKQDQQVEIHGWVESAENGMSLADVRVIPLAQINAGLIHTEDDGRYQLLLKLRNRNSYTFRFLRQGYREQRLTLQARDLEGIEDYQLDAQMEPVTELAEVSGIVTGAGMPLRTARIHLTSSAMKRSYQAYTNAQGYFSIPEVETGSDYRLWAHTKQEYQDYTEENVTIPASGAVFNLDLVPLMDNELEGHMVDADGYPVSNFTLWARTSKDTTPRYQQVTGDAEGRFIISHLPAGRVSLSTRSTPTITVSGIELPAGSQPVRLTLDWGIHQTAGRVTSIDGDPVAGAHASLLWSHEEKEIYSRSKRETISDSGGWFRFNRLGSGAHLLIVEANGFRPARIEHHVEADGREIEVQLAKIQP